jgi:hypothetical protein
MDMPEVAHSEVGNGKGWQQAVIRYGAIQKVILPERRRR